MGRKTTADDVRQVILAAVADALDDGKQEARKKPGLTGVRAVATGAVLYTAGRAAVAGRRFYRDRFGADAQDGDDQRDDTDDDEPRSADEEDYVDAEAEPEAEGDEDEYEEEYDDEDDEPRADAEEDEVDPADRPPVHGDGDGDGDHVDPDLPQRPSRRRKPVKT
jgi:hypothetical protein